MTQPTAEEGREIIQKAWALAVEVIDFLESKGDGAMVNPRVLITTVVFLLGRMGGRYGYQSISKEEMWKLTTDGSLRGLFEMAFDKERKGES